MKKGAFILILVFVFLSPFKGLSQAKKMNIEDEIRLYAKKAAKYLLEDPSYEPLPPHKFFIEPEKKLDKIPKEWEEAVKDGLLLDTAVFTQLPNGIRAVILYNYLVDSEKEKLRQMIIRSTDIINQQIEYAIYYMKKYLNAAGYSMTHGEREDGIFFTLDMFDIPIPQYPTLKEVAEQTYKHLLEQIALPCLQTSPDDPVTQDASFVDLAFSFYHLLICARILSIDIKQQEWYKNSLAWFKRYLAKIDEREYAHADTILHGILSLRLSEEYCKKLGLLDFDFKEERIKTFLAWKKKGKFKKNGAVLSSEPKPRERLISTIQFVYAFGDWYPVEKSRKQKQKHESQIETGKRK